MLEEYCDHNFAWAWSAVAGNRQAREVRLEALQAKKEAKTINPAEKLEAARLSRNAVAYEAMRHFRELAPHVDGQRRRGQYLAYRRGGKEAGGRGRHYPLSGY